MPFSARRSIVLVIATLLLSTGLSGRLGAKEAYAKHCLPLKCFMKDFCNVEDSFIERGETIRKSKQGIEDPKAAQEFQNVGKAFYEKYQGKFDTLLKDTEKILAEPLPSFTDEQVEALRSSTKIIDFRFSRIIAELLKAVAYHLYKSDKPREAIDLLRLIFRFGQIVSAGDGEAPNLLQGMLGYSIQSTTFADLPVMILHSTTLSADYLETVSESLKKMETKKIPLLAYLKAEFYLFTNTIRHEFDVMLDPKIEVNTPLIKVLGTMKTLEKKTLQKVWIQRQTDIQTRISEIYQRNIENPRAFRDETSSFSLELYRKAKDNKDGAGTDPIMKSADVLAAITFVNYGKVYQNLLRSRYRLLGTTILFKVAAFLKNGGTLPKTPDELKQILAIDLPLDLFSDKKGLCLFKHENERIVLYSVGENGLDDGGDTKQDIVLFRY